MAAGGLTGTSPIHRRRSSGRASRGVQGPRPDEKGMDLYDMIGQRRNRQNW